MLYGQLHIFLENGGDRLHMKTRRYIQAGYNNNHARFEIHNSGRLGK